MFRLLFGGFVATAGAALGSAPALAEESEIYPLAEVRVGQEGVWRTVVEGEEIREFNLRILGVVEHFAGPGQPVIMAEALDPEHILSGPVAGMSGSPVYIDGRIVGAYAYGYLWPKEQAVIGITPIERMLEIFDLPEAAPEREVASVGGRSRPFVKAASSADGPGQARLEAVPAPLMLGGFSERTIAAFRDELVALGFSPSASPQGSAEAIELNLRPGAPVAGVLMQGDFSAAATGTITWTDGQRLLAFGHPFMQAGPIELPLAGADVITVVRNLRSSFKLSNIGPPAGRLYQDRLTGIAGELGEVPRMTSLQLAVQPNAREPVNYEAELWPHPEYLPLLTAMSVLQSTSESIFAEAEQSMRLAGRIQLAGGEELAWETRSTGAQAGLQLALDTYARLGEVINNPFEPLAVTSVEMSLEAVSGVASTVLRQVQVGDARPRPGSLLPVTLHLQDYRGIDHRLELEVPIPDDLASGQEIELVITDAAGANEVLAASRRSANDVRDLLARWREQRPEGYVYAFLTAAENAPEVDGQSLPGLPPSIAATLSGEATDFIVASGGRHVRWETRASVDGVFSGQNRRTLRMR
ncbi:MAG: hypothetical protein ACLFR7_07125 [Opitutales bacterium]